MRPSLIVVLISDSVQKPFFFNLELCYVVASNNLEGSVLMDMNTPI